jgi:hypothetical protein
MKIRRPVVLVLNAALCAGLAGAASLADTPAASPNSVQPVNATSVARSPVSAAPAKPDGKFSQVYVSIFGFGDARVGAVLIDRNGRRTGWNVDRPIRQIPGCVHGYGSEDGITDENAPEDTTELAPADTVPGHPEPTPVYHEFSIQDSAGTPGLLEEGGCELRLDPVAGGHVTLAVTGTVPGFNACQETTSVTVKPGVSSRWRLEWKATQSRCNVRVSRMLGSVPTKRTPSR